MKRSQLEAITLPEITRACVWVFLSLFGLQVLLEYATATSSQPPAPLLQAAIESTLVTALFAILGASLVGRPLRKWMEGERQRVAEGAGVDRRPTLVEGALVLTGDPFS